RTLAAARKSPDVGKSGHPANGGSDRHAPLTKSRPVDPGAYVAPGGPVAPPLVPPTAKGVGPPARAWGGASRRPVVHASWRLSRESMGSCSTYQMVGSRRRQAAGRNVAKL